MESACQGRPVLSVAFSRSASALIVPSAGGVPSLKCRYITCGQDDEMTTPALRTDLDYKQFLRITP
ncbi:hypothetical protein CH63R_00392 [Colletotrichum higginsianum IMI 349063]|uniref:Uncharacterized protein n=1 Tax=Colletotrichum higginsianum (strain IMI 349063) TaxID=759273 RepID=A0A1B7YTD2_COLHI|nr:hypothetical protein CH63R_00392 [Colletotrichum higginsianum IMI 349063]OBR15212.1 hypothetical protein CH63R_00392 [Colletotrichum higginsianum IMI 349063]GJC92522.1 hypothetical protein ColKHC_01348 [Colletotrichum higginsianum]